MPLRPGPEGEAPKLSRPASACGGFPKPWRTRHGVESTRTTAGTGSAGGRSQRRKHHGEGPERKAPGVKLNIPVGTSRGGHYLGVSSGGRSLRKWPFPWW